jgi:endonuclease III
MKKGKFINGNSTYIQIRKRELRKLLTLLEETYKGATTWKEVEPKTADVFIAYCCGYSVFPIDTNINRVVKRIGIVQKYII